MKRTLLLSALLSLFAAGAGAQSLSGVWSLGDGEAAKCQVVFGDGSRGSSTAALGPLEITEAGALMHLEAGGRALRYSGRVHRSSDSAGTAALTSCSAVSAVVFDVPGTFHLTKLNALKGTLQGTFVGRWQNPDEIIVCKFKATRPEFSEPDVGACP